MTATLDRFAARRSQAGGPHSEQGLQSSVGIMAYNEEANIADAIAAILSQPLACAEIAELIVVASGCEDRTCEIVEEIAEGDSRVRLIVQERREGKASAINLFIAAAHSPVLLMVGADVLVREGTLDALLHHFQDPTVGMIGGHPIPVNSEATFLGHSVHLQWRLHDRIAREFPKLGEIVAFRNVVPSIPVDTPVDEISIQAIVVQLGYQLVYEPDAVVYNRGPTTVTDFLRQRRRIYAGHLRVRDQQGYSASTMSSRRVVRALRGSGSFAGVRAAVWSVGTVGLEATARGLGRYDVIRGRPQHVWAMCPTTKLHIAEDANGDGQQTVLVFHIVDFHRHELEFGAHTGRQLVRRVCRRVKQALGSDAAVSVQGEGTIVALVPGNRAEAERRAGELVRRWRDTPLSANGHGPLVPVTLSCAAIAFPRTGEPEVRSIPTREACEQWA
jgi:glycosyltransferase involved in cell wall biosynthesis